MEILFRFTALLGMESLPILNQPSKLSSQLLKPLNFRGYGLKYSVQLPNETQVQLFNDSTENDSIYNCIISIDSLNGYNFEINERVDIKTLITNNKISTENETSYSNNDSAIDVMNEGLLFLENELYSQAAENMLKSFSFKASNMDLNYFENLNLANNINDSLFYNAFKDISQDSLKSNAYFFLGMMDYQNNRYDCGENPFHE